MNHATTSADPVRCDNTSGTLQVLDFGARQRARHTDA
jgi:hypothetical protein